MTPGLIAVIDIGKTHARLFLIEASNGDLRWQTRHENRSVHSNSTLQLDVAGLERWLLASLASAPERERIRHIVPIAHGAAAVLIDESGNVVAAPDYEEPSYARYAESYQGQRDDYAATYSPALPLGLNLGLQWYALQHSDAERFAKVHQALLYPQYWAWRLCGIAASEITSLGCHTDLWRCVENRASELARTHGWDRLLPPLRRAGESLGPISASVVRATGLPADCQVLCGLHDSNAAYLSHRVARSDGRPFNVVSSGTWTVVLSPASPLSRLDSTLDMLANLDAFGHAVPTARFMGGREYAQIAGQPGLAATATAAACEHIKALGAMALPCFAPQGGPFAGRAASMVGAETLSQPSHWAALASVYLALMTDLLLDLLGSSGELIIDGPLTANADFAGVLSALRPSDPILRAAESNPMAESARYLVTGNSPSTTLSPFAPLADSEDWQRYRNRWRAALAIDDLPAMKQLQTHPL